MCIKCAAQLALEPPTGPVGIPWIRLVLGAGVTKARRVYHELLAAGVLAVDRMRDPVNGRVHGRRTNWVRRAFGIAKPVPNAPERALGLLRQLSVADKRLAFPVRESESLVTLVVARFAAGETDADVYTRLTARLPAGEVTTGLLQWRLSQQNPTTSQASSVPAPHGRLVECGECGRPSRDPLLDGLCGYCRSGTTPAPPDGETRARRLAALQQGYAG